MPGTGIQGLILAAGASKRFGPENKLLAKIDGEPLVRHVARQALASKLSDVHVVTGHEETAVGGALKGLHLNVIHNPDYEAGLSTSLRCGIEHLGEDVEGAMILLADMPGIDTRLLDDLIGLFLENGGDRIVYPTLPGGAQANPVIWPCRFFRELIQVEGDRGGKPLLKKHADEIVTLPVADPERLGDIDVPEDFSRHIGSREK